MTEKKKRRQFRPGDLKAPVKEVFNGTILAKDKTIKQLPFILFITVLGILYIANRYNAEKIVRETNELRNEINELRAQHIAVAAELMNESKQSKVAASIQENELELKESTKPPIIIYKE